MFCKRWWEGEVPPGTDAQNPTVTSTRRQCLSLRRARPRWEKQASKLKADSVSEQRGRLSGKAGPTFSFCKLHPEALTDKNKSLIDRWQSAKALVSMHLFRPFCALQRKQDCHFTRRTSGACVVGSTLSGSFSS